MDCSKYSSWCPCSDGNYSALKCGVGIIPSVWNRECTAPGYHYLHARVKVMNIGGQLDPVRDQFLERVYTHADYEHRPAVEF